jgi:valyl-tRNA synthetase
MINLKAMTPGPVDLTELPHRRPLDSLRLATVTPEVTAALESYRYADAAGAVRLRLGRVLQLLRGDGEGRLQDPPSNARTRSACSFTRSMRCCACCIPVMPFITEEVWQLLGQIAPSRGLTQPQAAPEWCITAPWPIVDATLQDQSVERRFAVFQAALAALREIRSRQNIAPRSTLEFSARCDAATAELLQPMAPYFQSMVFARLIAAGADVVPPATHAKASLPGIELFVDLKDFIDVPAEIAKNEQLEQKLLGVIKSKESKLASENFVSRAPANVVQSERDGLAQAQAQLASAREMLATLRKQLPA